MTHRPRARISQLPFFHFALFFVELSLAKSNRIEPCVPLFVAQDLEQLKVEGKSPCGMVTVTLTGQQMPVSCDISEEALAEGAKALGEKVRVCMAVSPMNPYAGHVVCRSRFNLEHQRDFLI